MRLIIRFVAIIQLLSCGALCSFNNRHDVWESYLKKARANKYYAYGIYASRIMAVCCPEVYLQADVDFLKFVDNKHMRTKTYKHGVSQITTRTFRISEFDLDGYNIIKSSEHYPFACTLYDYVDRRVFPSLSLIRMVEDGEIVRQNAIKEIEKSILYCAKMNHEHNYIIYCDNENSYIFVDNTMISAKNLKPVDNISGNPILIFNKTSVWYPLMERDDSGSDEALSMLVDRVKTDKIVPDLTEEEKNIVYALKDITTLHSEVERNMALLSASKRSSYFGYKDKHIDQAIYAMYKKVFHGIDESHIKSLIGRHPSGGLDNIVIKEIVKRGNYLSPLAYYLSTLDMEDVRAAYQDLFAWNCIWTLGFETFSIDESSICRGGTCSLHAVNWSSIFDLKKEENIMLHGYKPGSFTHQIVYIPGNKHVCSNTSVLQNNSIYSSYTCPNGLFLLSYGDSWCAFVHDAYYGNVSPNEAIKKLLFLKGEFGDEICGLDVKHMKKISLDALLLCLKDKDNWERVRLP